MCLILNILVRSHYDRVHSFIFYKLGRAGVSNGVRIPRLGCVTSVEYVWRIQRLRDEEGCTWKPLEYDKLGGVGDVAQGGENMPSMQVAFWSISSAITNKNQKANFGIWVGKWSFRSRTFSQWVSHISCPRKPRVQSGIPEQKTRPIATLSQS